MTVSVLVGGVEGGEDLGAAAGLDARDVVLDARAVRAGCILTKRVGWESKAMTSTRSSGPRHAGKTSPTVAGDGRFHEAGSAFVPQALLWPEARAPTPPQQPPPACRPQAGRRPHTEH